MMPDDPRLPVYSIAPSGRAPVNVLRPVRTHSARAQSILRERLLSGELAPGTRLFEVATAEALAISRPPVREAMARMAEEGLLERAPGVSVGDIRNATAGRLLVEGDIPEMELGRA